ncbi:MAG: hypothetical protein V4733_06675 [Verrucomicrobiota bacterium]
MENHSPPAWFYCARCDSLFASHPGVDDNRRCSECGALSTGAIREAATVAVTANNAAETSAIVRMSTRRRKTNRLAFKLVVAWSVFIVALFLIGRCVRSNHKETKRPDRSTDAGTSMTAADAKILATARSGCLQTLHGFLAAKTFSERGSFVFSPVETTAKMAVFYRQNAPDLPDFDELSPVGWSVIRIDDNPAIEMRAVLPQSPGRQFDFVFRQNDGNEWRLDWEALVIYREHRWPLFLAGVGPDEAEFRLYARERTLKNDQPGEKISVVLYNPQLGNPQDVGRQSPEFLIPRDSADGNRLAAGFQMEKEGKRPFASRLPSTDPDGLIRVRVRVRRRKTDDGLKFDIVKVAACHWYGTDQPGEPVAADSQNR